MKSKLFLATFVMGVLVGGGAASYAATATQAGAADPQTSNQSEAGAKGKKESKVKKSAQDVKKGTVKTGKTVGKGAKKVGNAAAKGTEEGAKETAKGAEKAGKATTKGVKKVGKKM